MVQSISIQQMRAYLSTSLSSLNANKLNGIRAEIDFRNHIASLGFGDRVSPGGWLLRNTHNNFGHYNLAIFPQTINPVSDYSAPPANANIPVNLHTICATFNQIGIQSYYAHPVVESNQSLKWLFVRLGVPRIAGFVEIDEVIQNFKQRERPYNFLRYKADAVSIEDQFVPEEFSKESLRIFVQNRVISEMVDIDGILWGEQHTYPIEIKEKTPATDKNLGEYFGLDVGPFVKLAFYAAKKGNLHSLFVVREIEDVVNRQLKQWLFITYERLAQFASWQKIGGGTNMQGGASTVIRIPKVEFSVLNRDEVERL